jgi:hypothetical protein
MREGRSWMEKKSLGRGLDDISSTFMSTGKTPKPQEMTPDFLSAAIREASCSACLNIVAAPFDPPKCRIFSFESEKYGVSAMDSIMHEYAKYCRYFEPLVPKDVNKDMTLKSEPPNEDEVHYHIEETVNSHKRISFQNNGNVQKNLKRMLSKHLEEGYEITSIDLEKTEEHSEPGLRKKRHEEVSILKI